MSKGKRGITTWVFDYNSFVPAAKIVDGNTYSIACDDLEDRTQKQSSRLFFSECAS
ncbi:hypothetical protein [uncultured Maribacter sp.]|uniref:hypothetical protein n=1 Tax=uncultured Maribacter sp. TaxID=431308 RepID=UPI00261EAD83|nr:hypothetical protein [uncultured Maribacter sp.]